MHERLTAVPFVPATRGTLRLQNRPQTFLAFAICGAFALRADWMTQLSISCKKKKRIRIRPVYVW